MPEHIGSGQSPEIHVHVNRRIVERLLDLQVVEG
jgi:hypothetical protein